MFEVQIEVKSDLDHKPGEGHAGRSKTQQKKTATRSPFLQAVQDLLKYVLKNIADHAIQSYHIDP